MGDGSGDIYVAGTTYVGNTAGWLSIRRAVMSRAYIDRFLKDLQRHKESHFFALAGFFLQLLENKMFHDSRVPKAVFHAITHVLHVSGPQHLLKAVTPDIFRGHIKV